MPNHFHPKQMCPVPKSSCDLPRTLFALSSHSLRTLFAPPRLPLAPVAASNTKSSAQNNGFRINLPLGYRHHTSSQFVERTHQPPQPNLTAQP